MLLSMTDRISGPLKKVARSVGGIGDAADKSAKQFIRLSNQVDKLAKDAKRLDGLGKPLLAFGAAGAVGIGSAIVQAATFETAMLGVAKQVEGARDSAGNLTLVYHDMYREIQRLGRELPLATNEIADMVTAGARMGIAKDELIGFTKTAAMMAAAFDLPAGELADQMGQVAKLFSIPIPEIGKLADVINYLDDNAISKGGDIIEVMKRIGGTAAFVRMPQEEAAALASTFLTLGSTAEVAATAANAVMRELSVATMQPKRFQTGLDEIGMSAKKLQADMTQDATGTIQKVLAAINKLPQEKRLTVATQLFGKEYGDDIAKLAGSVAEYKRQLDLVKSGGAVGSMQREFDSMMRTTDAQWKTTKNKLAEISVNFGAVLLPAVNKILVVFGPIATAAAKFAATHPGMAKILTAITAIALVAGGLLVTIAAVGAAVTPFMTGVAALARLFPLLGGGIRLVMLAFNALRVAMLTNPVGLTITGIAVAALLIYKYWEPITAFFTKIWRSVVDIAGKMREAGATLITMLWEGIKSMASKPIEAVRDIVQRIRNFLPFSPAKDGPLRDIHRIRIVETIAETIKPGPMVKAMRTATAATMIAATGASPAHAGGTGSTVHYSPTINLAPGTPGEVRRQVDEALLSSKAEFEKMFDRLMQQKQRRAF